MHANLLQNGLPARTADIHARMSSGALAKDYTQHKPALGKVKREEFAQEFAAAFRSGK